MYKPSLRFCEEYLSMNDAIRFKGGLTKLVERYDGDTHRITFYGEKPIDFWSIYDDIEYIAFRNVEGDMSVAHFGAIVREAILDIQELTKYKPYKETILAFTTGDKDHYIYEYCKDCQYFGDYPQFGLDAVEMALDLLIAIGYVKEKISPRGKKYYAMRKDFKRWKIIEINPKGEEQK